MDEEQLEKEALAQIDPEAIKTEIIADMGFDPEADKERIEKAVAREVKTRTMASKAIGSKIKAKKDLDEYTKANPKKENNVFPDEFDKKLDQKLNERLEQRDIDALDYPDELKEEIKRIAKLSNTTVKKILLDPYIKSKIDAVKKDEKTEDASISRTNKSGTNKAYDINKPPQVDMHTPEGRKTYEEWRVGVKASGH